MTTHGVTPEPPTGSAQYRHGWRDGYEQAQIEATAELERLRTYETTAPCLAKMIDEIKEALGARVDATHAEVLARIDLLGPMYSLRSRDEAAQAVVRNWITRTSTDWVHPEFRALLDALARAHEEAGHG